MSFVGKRVKPKIPEAAVPADCKLEQSFTNAAGQLAATGTAHVQSVGGHVLQSDTEILQADGTTIPVVGAVKDVMHDVEILERRMNADWVARFAKVEQALATIAHRVAEIEKPDYPELINRRWVELKELVEFISVVTHQDVLNNILSQMRVSKREIEERVRSGTMAGLGDSVPTTGSADHRGAAAAASAEAGAASTSAMQPSRAQAPVGLLSPTREEAPDPQA